MFDEDLKIPEKEEVPEDKIEKNVEAGAYLEEEETGAFVEEIKYTDDDEE